MDSPKGAARKAGKSKTRRLGAGLAAHPVRVGRVYPPAEHERVVLAIENAPWHAGEPIRAAPADDPHLELKRSPRPGPPLNPLGWFRRVVTHNRPFDAPADPWRFLRNSLCSYGRRGKGYVFGVFVPATGAAFTHPYPGRTRANWAYFLERVERWLPADAMRVYAVLDNLAAHASRGVHLFNVACPRWDFVFQPVYLNLIESWWKVLRSPALKGRQFDTWAQIAAAVERATG